MAGTSVYPAHVVSIKAAAHDDLLVTLATRELAEVCGRHFCICVRVGLRNAPDYAGELHAVSVSATVGDRTVTKTLEGACGVLTFMIGRAAESLRVSLAAQGYALPLFPRGDVLDGLVHRWRLDEDIRSMIAADDFDGENPAQSSIPINFQQIGVQGTAADFHGVQYLVAPPVWDIDDFTEITISAWFSASSLGDEQRLFGTFDDGVWGVVFAQYTTYSPPGINSWNFRFGCGSETGNHSVEVSLAVNTWHHFVMTHVPGADRGYLDGVEIFEGSARSGKDEAGGKMIRRNRRRRPAGNAEGVWSNGMGPHACVKENEIADLRGQVDRVEKELYVGRERREPVLIRVDRIERIAGWMVYVATALLISTILAVGGLVWSAASRPRLAAVAAAARAE